jgi:hypothetical protein
MTSSIFRGGYAYPALGACLVLALGCGENSDTPKASAGSGNAGGSSSQASGGSGQSTGGGGKAAAGSAGKTSTGGTPSGGNSASGGDEPGGDGGGSTDPGPIVSIEGCKDAEAAAEAPPTTWFNATGNLAGMASECSNLAKIAAQPCSKTVIASVATKGLWATEDSGKTWRALGGGGGDKITNRGSSIVFDPLHPEKFWESGIAGDGGVYATTDNGQTFKRLGMMTQSQLVSIDFTDVDRKTLVVGTHGMRQMVFLSTDSGTTWDNVGMNLAGDVHNSEAPLVMDSKTYLLGACGGGDGTCGIFRTTDSGKTWNRQTDLQVSHFGAPLRTTEGVIYWPLYADGGIGKSVDNGVTWEKVTDGGKVVGVAPVELPDGSLAAVGFDHLQRSTDGGKTWTPIGEPLPFSIFGNQLTLTYSAALKTFFLSHWDCDNLVLPDAVMAAGFDYAAP